MSLNRPRPLAITILAASFGAMGLGTMGLGTTGSALAQQLGAAANGGQGGVITTQTGESSNFTIQRDVTDAVMSPSTNFLSKPATNFGTVEGYGSFSSGGGRTSGLGGIGGLNTLGGGRGGLGGIGGIGGNQFGGNQFGGNQFGGIQAGQVGVAGGLPLRHRIRVDVEVSPSSMTRVSRAFAQRLTRLPGLTGLHSVDVKMEGQTVVLTGSVDSDRMRDLVARLAMLEPGIAAVRNELSVEPTEALPESLQRPTR